MICLIDTHTFLWFINNDKSLSAVASELLESSDNQIYLSIASIWEMAIKVSLGRLTLPEPFGGFLDEQMEINDIDLLGIKTAHTGVVAKLPFHHRDPFDRLIIAQSQYESFPIIGKDEVFDDYHVTRLW